MLVEFDALDTLFFGDGRPFDQMDAGLAAASSRFPPLPSVLSGAILAAYGQALGFDPAADKGDWKNAAQRIGTDTQEGELLCALAKLVEGDPATCANPPLRFSGPYLKKGDNLFFPTPHTLMVRQSNAYMSHRHFANWKPEALGKRTVTDGEMQFLPAFHAGRGEQPADYEAMSDDWLHEDKFRQYIGNMDYFGLGEINVAHILLGPNGAHPALVRQPHMGLALTPQTRTAREGMLYSADHVRLGGDGGDAIKIVVQVTPREGVDLPTLPALLPLGGESRAVYVHIDDAGQDFSGIELQDTQPGTWDWPSGHISCRLVALTPVPCGEGPFGLPMPLPPPLEPENIVCAVCPRPETVGLWSHRTRSTQLFRVFPAGSTWFVKIKKDAIPVKAKKKAKKDALTQKVEVLLEMPRHHRLAPPELAWMGYGVFAVGKWSQ